MELSEIKKQAAVLKAKIGQDIKDLEKETGETPIIEIDPVLKHSHCGIFRGHRINVTINLSE